MYCSSVNIHSIVNFGVAYLATQYKCTYGASSCFRAKLGKCERNIIERPQTTTINPNPLTSHTNTYTFTDREQAYIFKNLSEIFFRSSQSLASLKRQITHLTHKVRQGVLKTRPVDRMWSIKFVFVARKPIITSFFPINVPLKFDTLGLDCQNQLSRPECFNLNL